MCVFETHSNSTTYRRESIHYGDDRERERERERVCTYLQHKKNVLESNNMCCQFNNYLPERGHINWDLEMDYNFWYLCGSILKRQNIF